MYQVPGDSRGREFENETQNPNPKAQTPVTLKPGLRIESPTQVSRFSIGHGKENENYHGIQDLGLGCLVGNG